MAFLRNEKAPASAPGGLVWETTEHVVEVADHLAHELLHIHGGGFTEVLPGDAAHPLTIEAEAKAAAEAQAAADAAAKAAKAAPPQS